MMHNYVRLALLLCTAAMVVSLMTASAGANRFSLSHQDIEVIWEELTFDSSSGEVICEVTLLGSFHSLTITKVEGALVGFITHATFNLPGCTGVGKIQADQDTLPWHISYEGFEGTLPNIAGIKLLLTTDLDILELPFGITCSYGGNSSYIAIPEAGGTTLEADETVQLPKNGGGFLCPDERSFRGAAAVTELDSGRPLIIRLV